MINLVVNFNSKILTECKCIGVTVALIVVPAIILVPPVTQKHSRKSQPITTLKAFILMLFNKNRNKLSTLSTPSTELPTETYLRLQEKGGLSK